MKGHAFIISGPSGTGKSTVISEVFKKRGNCRFSISATTRKPRKGETDGVEYYFVTPERFQEMLDGDELLEYAEFVGCRYGTPKKPILDMLDEGFDVILDIEVQGARQVREKLPEVMSIFIYPPSIEELERRLRNRSLDSDEVIARRLKTAEEELLCMEDYDYLVQNDDYIRAANEIIDIMDKVKNDAEK